MGQRSIDRLSDEDVQILRREHGEIAGHTCKVLVLEAPDGEALPTVEDVRRHVSARLDGAPRLRQRVVPTPLRVANPVWLDDPEFDIRNHVRPVDTGGPVERAELDRIVGRLMGERLDRSRPLWRLDVVERLGRDRIALIWRIHHCMADGSTCVRLGAAVLWSELPSACGPACEWAPAPPPAPIGLLASGLATRARTSRARLARSRRSGARIRETADVLRRELGPRASVTPLAHRVGPARITAFATAPLQQLKRAGKAIGEAVTLNDVVLALIAGGIRRWREHDHAPTEHMRVKVPVSLHEPGEGEGRANRDSYFFVDLPLGEPDPAERLLSINRQTAERKLDHDAETVYRLGHHALVAHWAMSPHVFTLSVSNVRGPASRVYVLGAPVREMYSLAEISQHHALRIAVISYGECLSFGLCGDRDAVPDLHRLADALQRSADELLALHAG